jgi:hypothetical protein
MSLRPINWAVYQVQGSLGLQSEIVAKIVSTIFMVSTLTMEY